VLGDVSRHAVSKDESSLSAERSSLSPERLAAKILAAVRRSIYSFDRVAVPKHLLPPAISERRDDYAVALDQPSEVTAVIRFNHPKPI
jgi:hypothetical protein